MRTRRMLRMDSAPREISTIGFFAVAAIDSCWLQRQRPTAMRHRSRSACSFVEEPCGARISPCTASGKVWPVRSHDWENLRPADGRDSGLIGGNVRTDLFDNDLFDLLGKALGDFHVLQNTAGFGDSI